MKIWLVLILPVVFLACEKNKDQPPIADFTISQQSGDTYTDFEFDAQQSTDPDGPDSLLKFKWDWESDGIFDLLYDFSPLAQHRFDEAGSYTITLQTIDQQGLTNSSQKIIEISRGSIAPLDPFAPNPSDSSNNIIFAGHLSWVSIDPDDDPMTYDIYLGNNAQPLIWKQNLSETRISAPELSPGKKYYWQVVATDDTGNTTVGPMWRFSIHSGRYQTDTILDQRDGKKYGTIKIGSYWWMTENLRFNKPGTSKCRNDLEENCEKYGRYYHIFTRDTTVCPEGWFGPDRYAINDLEEALGMSEEDSRKYGVWRGKDQGTQLSPNGTSGINLTYDGYLDTEGKWQKIGEVRYFGSYTTHFAPVRMIEKGYGGILYNSNFDAEYVPVRCVKYN